MIRFLWLIALLASTLLPMQAYGQGWSFDDASSGLGMFALGLASGYGAHELGHAVVATAKEYKVSHDGLSIVYPDAAFTDADRLQVASAGFQTQWLMAELALRKHNGQSDNNSPNDDLPNNHLPNNHFKVPQEPPDNFAAGVVCAHLGITLAYLTVLKNHPQGDVAGIAAATKRSNDQIALALAIPGALDAWRLFGSQAPEWVPQLSVLSKGLEMAWIWSY